MLARELGTLDDILHLRDLRLAGQSVAQGRIECSRDPGALPGAAHAKQRRGDQAKKGVRVARQWWARQGLNLRPLACEANAVPLSDVPWPPPYAM